MLLGVAVRRTGLHSAGNCAVVIVPDALVACTGFVGVIVGVLVLVGIRPGALLPLTVGWLRDVISLDPENAFPASEDFRLFGFDDIYELQSQDYDV